MYKPINSRSLVSLGIRNCTTHTTLSNIAGRYQIAKFWLSPRVTISLNLTTDSSRLQHDSVCLVAAPKKPVTLHPRDET